MSKKPSPAPRRRGLLLVSLLSLSVLGVGGTLTGLALSKSDGFRIPKSPSERILGAKAALVGGLFEEAEALVRSALSEDPRDLNDQLLLARILREAGKLSAARETLDRLHKDHPGSAEVLAGLGDLHERRGEAELALACHRRATELDPKHAGYWRTLGMAQYRKRDLMAALFSLRQSQKLRAGQEDVAKVMDEIALARSPLAGPPGKRGGDRENGDPFAPPGLPRAGFPGGRAFDPSRPSPLVPNPLEGLPVPGGARP